jgi:hypothetical protein
LFQPFAEDLAPWIWSSLFEKAWGFVFSLVSDFERTLLILWWEFVGQPKRKVLEDLLLPQKVFPHCLGAIPRHLQSGFGGLSGAVLPLSLPLQKESHLPQLDSPDG